MLPAARIWLVGKKHGVEVRPVDVNDSFWDNTLEALGGGHHALRLGFRQVSGFKQAAVERIVAARGNGYPSIADVQRRSGITHACLEVLAAADLLEIKDGARIRLAGVVLVRQRPGTASGVIFMTIEDETGVANLIIWPKVMDKFRSIVMGAKLVEVTGRVQKADGVIHVIAISLKDQSQALTALMDGHHDLPDGIPPNLHVPRTPPPKRSHHPSVQGLSLSGTVQPSAVRLREVLLHR